MMELKMKDKIIVGVLLVLAVIVFIGGRIHATKTNFDSEKWINYEGNSRQLMIQNLVDRTRFVGMTRDEVIADLGEAEDAQDYQRNSEKAQRKFMFHKQYTSYFFIIKNYTMQMSKKQEGKGNRPNGRKGKKPLREPQFCDIVKRKIRRIFR